MKIKTRISKNEEVERSAVEKFESQRKGGPISSLPTVRTVMESGHFLETTSSVRCREMTNGEGSVHGPSGSLPLLLNASSTSDLCNGSSEQTAVDNETDVAGTSVPQFNQLSLVKTIVLSAMFVVAFTGNVATLMRMYRMRRRRSTINLLITHLATADLFVTFFCNVTDAVWTATVQWLAGNAACKLIKFLQVRRARYNRRLC